MKREQQQKTSQEETTKNHEEEDSSAAGDESDNQNNKPKEEEIVTEARSWTTSKKEGFIFFRVHIESKLTSQEVKIWYRLSHASESDPSITSGLNAYLPRSWRKVTLN